MNYDFSKLDQKPSNWFQEKLEYYGDGMAEFENPKGKIFGQTKVRITEQGDIEIQMEVDKIESELPLPLGVKQLISGDIPNYEDNNISLTLPPKKENKCDYLQVITKRGVFKTKKIGLISWSFSVHNDKAKDIISFYPTQSEYIQENSVPIYWVLPLNNYVGNFSQYEKKLATHPLRIFPDAKLPDDLPGEYKETAEDFAREKSKFILFDFCDETGFIEGLPNYQERVRKLRNYEEPSLITAVMVANIGDYSMDLEKIDVWFPFYFLDLLSLATGSEVTSPWIEFRDENGILVKRIHLLIPRTLFLKGKKTLNEDVYHGTGTLLTIAQSCEEIKETYFEVALRHTVLGGREGQSIVDKLAYLCRGLDSLCEHYNLASQNLLDPFDSQIKDEIKEIVKDATKAIKKIQSHKGFKARDIEYQYLEKINSRIINAPNKDNDFGLAVCKLLELFNMPDAKILNNFYEKNINNNVANSWACLLSRYRGAAIHTGFFHFLNSDSYIKDSLTITNHLHDILVRILFKIIGYDGKYQPSMFSYCCPSEIDWIKSDTSPYYLG